MNGMIFDWADNSQNILDGKGYTTKAHQTFEQIMLFRYLLDLGYTYDEIYKKWVETNSLLIQRTADDMQERQKWFAKLLQGASKKKILTGNKIKIYQEEIDFINSMNVSLWVKQYALAMLCVYKWYGKEWCPYDDKIKVFCYSVTDIKRESRDGIPKILSEAINEYNLFELKFSNTYLSCKVNFQKNNGVVIEEINNPREVIELLSLLKCEKVCKLCGKKYSYNYHTKHLDICPKCYKKQRDYGHVKRTKWQ